MSRVLWHLFVKQWSEDGSIMGFNTDQHASIQFRFTSCFSGLFATAEEAQKFIQNFLRELALQKRGTVQSNIYSHSSSRLCHLLSRLLSSTQEAHSNWQTWKTFVSGWVLGNEPIRGVCQGEQQSWNNSLWHQFCMAIFLTETAVKTAAFLCLWDDLIFTLWNKKRKTSFHWWFSAIYKHWLRI